MNKYNVGDLIVEDLFIDPKNNHVNLVTWADEEHVELLATKYGTIVYAVKRIDTWINVKKARHLKVVE